MRVKIFYAGWCRLVSAKSIDSANFAETSVSVACLQSLSIKKDGTVLARAAGDPLFEIAPSAIALSTLQ
jgi:hypothetical protein